MQPVQLPADLGKVGQRPKGPAGASGRREQQRLQPAIIQIPQLAQNQFGAVAGGRSELRYLLLASEAVAWRALRLLRPAC
jgi:hypothetical protein